MAPYLSRSDIELFEASQYLSAIFGVIAVGLVILLWDHVLNFPDEVQLIWRAKLSIPKVLFLFNRYMVPLAMLVQSHEFSGAAPHLSLTVSTCKVWSAIALAAGMLSIATSNFLILLRLWVLWDRCPRLMLGTLTFFVVTQLVAMSLAGYVIYETLPTLFFDPLLRVCIPTTKPKYVLLWSPGIAFESMIFLTTVWNALDRPRSRDSAMTKIMYRDGCMYFFGLFALRLANLVTTIFAPVSLVFIGVFFIWSVSNITLSHLVLNLRRLSRDAGDEAKEQEDGTEEYVEHTELRALRRAHSGGSDLESERKVMV